MAEGLLLACGHPVGCLQTSGYNAHYCEWCAEVERLRNAMTDKVMSEEMWEKALGVSRSIYQQELNEIHNAYRAQIMDLRLKVAELEAAAKRNARWLGEGKGDCPHRCYSCLKRDYVNRRYGPLGTDPAPLTGLTDEVIAGPTCPTCGMLNCECPR